MSWGISETAQQKEKIFSSFADDINGMNCCGKIDYNAYSKVFDLGRELADREYQQGREDEQMNILNWFNDMGWMQAVSAMYGYFEMHPNAEQIKEKSKEK